MDFNDEPHEAAFRDEARRWLSLNAPDFEEPLSSKWSDVERVQAGKAWQRRLQQGGYAGILLPKGLGGRGGTLIEEVIFAEEESKFRLPKGPYVVIGTNMAVRVIGKHGTDDQIKRFIEPTLKGDITWCQLFSEPGAGSDLAAVRTRAVRQGDEWVVNGQKVWSSWAHHASWGFAVLRTDPSLPKHLGLTFFVIDMKSPGIEIRPIRQISGASDFNATFFSDVRVPDSNRIGMVGEGWTCAMTVLTSERLGQSENPGELGGIRALIRLAAETPREQGYALDSAYIRTALASALAEEQAERHLQSRLRTMVSRGGNPGALAAAVKLAYASRLQKTSGLAMEMREMAGVAGAEDEELTRIRNDYLWSAALRVAGGADEVLRNQLAERVLNLPSEPRADKNIPFDQL